MFGFAVLRGVLGVRAAAGIEVCGGGLVLGLLGFLVDVGAAGGGEVEVGDDGGLGDGGEEVA